MSPFYKFSSTVAAGMILAMSMTGCRKQILVDAPITSTNTDIVFSSDATAANVLTGMYVKIASSNQDVLGASPGTLYYYPALSADELTVFEPSNQSNATFYVPYFYNDINTVTSAQFWTFLYPQIYVANSAIDGLTKSATLTPSVKQQLLGEAKFMRAFCYFYLVNFYGDVPLVLTTDYKVNAVMGRTPKEKVWEQIISDLRDAQTLLSPSFLNGTVSATTTERVRPTRWAATAMLARAYLYTGDYGQAETQATAVIENSAQFKLGGLADLFLKNSNETIWAIQPVGTGAKSNTGEGLQFILPAAGPSNFVYYVYLSEDIVKSFEAGDGRLASWVSSVTVNGVTYNYPYKYKVGPLVAAATEYEILFRLAEQFLIRAEARAQLNKLTDAAADLDIIRDRAGLLPTTASTQPELLDAIMQERKVELFTEGGHRWLDLKRTGRVDAVMK